MLSSSCRGIITPALFIASLLIASCSSNETDNKHSSVKKAGSGHPLFRKEAFVQLATESFIPVAADSGQAKIQAIPEALTNAYKLNGFAPFWISEDGITSAAESFIKELDSLRYDGLDPENFSYTSLQRQIERLRQASTPALQECFAFDTACTRAYLQASRTLLFGLLTPKEGDGNWFHANDSSWNAGAALQATLGKEGKYPSLNNYRSTALTYELLRKEYMRYAALCSDKALLDMKSVAAADMSDSLLRSLITKEIPDFMPADVDTLSEQGRLLLAYQHHYGLKATSRPDSNTLRQLRRHPDSTLQVIAANMERIRWMPRQTEAEYVLVNIPLMEMMYRKGNKDAMRMRAVVGKPGRATPSLNADMTNIVFNPPWGVPPTILKQEVLPGIAKRGGSYLSRRGLKAYDRRGRLVNAASISKKNLKQYSFRQPPGAHNALGVVKFNLPNRHDIYLHDTPHKEDFPQSYRARSSGCIRLQHPRDFAEFLLKEIERKDFSRPVIDSIVETRVTKVEQLQKKIPVHIIYLTAFEDSTGSRLRFLSDIYNKDKKLIAALRSK